MERTSPLLTDLYQLTMLQAYFDQGMTDTAVFEFFVRKLPPGRNFLMAAGLEQVLSYLEQLQFSEQELDWLAACGRFSGRFVDWLHNFRFTGDVHAMPEGSIFFADEPILRVTAPLPQAQLIETRVINLLQCQTMVASKAARVRLAAPYKLLVDLACGARMAPKPACCRHGPVTWRDLTAAPTCWRRWNGAFRSLAPWPTPSLRPTTWK
ncbi:Nicotinate phosphoribosyltransferase (NAPRTase) [sediment metagenome]|uniref:Nicotinate phosphoribosyltransferase (NAPRTase) n=1 Tax=sediment metagenome TaxID=749907 RepID=D9PLJ8_9ZZZZ